MTQSPLKYVACTLTPLASPILMMPMPLATADLAPPMAPVSVSDHLAAARLIHFQAPQETRGLDRGALTWLFGIANGPAAAEWRARSVFG